METEKIEAIYGAICGDIIGSAYEFRGVDERILKMWSYRCRFTDDTVCTIAITDWLTHDGADPAEYLIKYAKMYPTVGYGKSFGLWAVSPNPQPFNSCGNGSAMRVSAVGCIAETVDEAMELAKKSAECTHNHPEGIKGAQAIAVAIVLAKQGKNKGEIKETLKGLFDSNKDDEFPYRLDRTYEDLRKEEYKFNILCQTTVPESLICFFESDSYEDAIKKAMLTNKDTDTAACIAGAVAGAYYGVPDDYIQNMAAYLPENFIEVIDNFEDKLNGTN